MQLPDGAHIHNPSSFRNLSVIGASTSTPSFDGYAPFTTLDIEALDCTFKVSGIGTASLFRTTGGFFNLFGFSRLQNAGNGFDIIDNSVTSIVVTLNLYDSAIADGYTVKIIDGYSALNVNIQGPTAFFDTNQNTTAPITYYGANLVGGFTAAPVGAIPFKTDIGQTNWVVPFSVKSKGFSTLVNGTSMVTGLSFTLDGYEQILLTRNTPFGSAIGILCAPDGYRSGTGFSIFSLKTDGYVETADQSKLDWVIFK